MSEKKEKKEKKEGFSFFGKKEKKEKEEKPQLMPISHTSSSPMMFETGNMSGNHRTSSDNVARTSSMDIETKKWILSFCAKSVRGASVSSSNDFHNLICVFKIGSEIFTTPKGSVIPEDQQLRASSVATNFECKVDYNLSEILIELQKAQENGKPPISLGHAQVSLELLIGEDSVEQWFELLKDNGGSSGEVLLSLELQNPYRKERIESDGSRHRRSSSTGPSPIEPNTRVTMMEVLEKFKPKSTGNLPADVSQTIVECFLTLLKENVLQMYCLQNIEEFKKYIKGLKIETNDLCGSYKSHKFSAEKENQIIATIIEWSEPGKMKMNQIVQNMVVFILTSWQFPEAAAKSYARQAFTRNYESGILNGIGLTGWGKKMLPFFSKAVIATGICVYCLLRQTYIQYIDRFFSDGVLELTKLPNPDYYGRLGGAVFFSLVGKITKISTSDFTELMNFVFAYEIAPKPPETKSKLCKSFLDQLHSLRKPFNTEKYLSGYNYVTAQTIPQATESVNNLLGTNGLMRSTTSKMMLDSMQSKLLSLSECLTKANEQKDFSVIFTSESREFCVWLDRWFRDEPSVQVVQGCFMDSEDIPFDCLVIQSNAYGFPELNLTADLNSMFGESLSKNIRKYINENYLGELPLGTACMFQTGSEKVPWLAYNCSYYSNKPINGYIPLWGALISIYQHNRDVAKGVHKLGATTKPIRTVVCEIFQTEAKQEHARDMFFAWRKFHNAVKNPDNLPKTMTEAMKEDEIRFATSSAFGLTTTLTPTEKQEQELFEQDLLTGRLEKRGFMDEFGMKNCVQLFLHSNNQSLREAAARCIAIYAFPDFRNMIVDSNAVGPLLEFASTGRCRVWNEISESQVTMGEFVAKGATGEVFKGKFKDVDVAVKICGSQYVSFDINEFWREISIGTVLRHPNLLSCMAASTSNLEKLLICTEWLSHGTLFSVLHSSVEITWPMRISIAAQIASGLDFLHSFNLVHADIKSLNVMLGDNYIVKIIDFGNSQIVGSATATGALGTTQYIAPELLIRKKAPYTFACDMYSFAMVCYELLSREIPWHTLQPFDVPDKVMAGERPTIPKEMQSHKFSQLVVLAWNGDPRKRPSFLAIKEKLKVIGEEYHLYV